MRNQDHIHSPKKLFNKIDVCHDHSAATVPLATKLIHSITLTPVLAKQFNLNDKQGKWSVKLTHLGYPHRVAVGNVPKDLRRPV